MIMLSGAEADVWKEIANEIRIAVDIHPNYPTDPLRRVALICEESGEALKEALDLTRPTDEVLASFSESAVVQFNMRREVVQTAAMAVKMLIEMRKEALS